MKNLKANNKEELLELIGKLDWKIDDNLIIKDDVYTSTVVYAGDLYKGDLCYFLGNLNSTTYKGDENMIESLAVWYECTIINERTGDSVYYEL